MTLELLSLNYLFLLNAVFLLSIGIFLLVRSKTDDALVFFIACLGLTTWNLSNFLLEERLMDGMLGLIVCFQLLGAMVFANGLLYFSSLYPVNTIGRWHVPNIAIFLLLAFAIFVTTLVSRAEIIDDNIVYHDGPGFVVFSIYLSILGLSAIYKLVKSYQSQPQFRSRIRYFIIGIVIYVVAAITFNMLLPSLGNYDYLLVGRLSATAAPVAIFYAMTKHEFLDASVIINRNTAWSLVLLILIGLLVLVDRITAGMEQVHFVTLGLLLTTAALYAQPLQKFLLTTAKRKFVRGWYSTEEVFSDLSGRITQEKNREAIFLEVLRVLDEVFELERSMSIVAVRDQDEQVSFYRISDRIQKIKSDDRLITAMDKFTSCQWVKDAPADVRVRLDELEFTAGDKGVILPFHSPEILEGLLVLGERSSQVAFTDVDLMFFNNLITFVSPILYRLTPMEKLENLYNDSRKRLHEAEIQLIRAQKVEAIVHATRQCHHEIRTPLNIIRMGINRIKTLEDLESYKEVAREEIDHALAVVEETLAITDVSETKGRQFIPVDVNEIIQRCTRLIDKSRYQIVLELAPLPLVPAIGSDIQVVLINLIHNAIDAMPDGGTLAFATRATSAFVEVTLEDTGSGIPEAMRSRVWEPYVSGKPTEVGNSTAGRGWGLTIANRIINEHGGTIKFTSVENHGTLFTFTLPVNSEARRGVESLGTGEKAL
jgi:signal transduction histidine kinase